jgi:serine/threonine protein kinase/tetratricopeptide (TPR) repeat protein
MFKRQPKQPIIAVGALLDDRYRLLNQLGQGGAGVIYKAEDEQLNRIVALKVLSGDGSGMAADKLERFRSEARSVARLNHPNIVTLYDYAEQEAQPYLVLEYVPGQDLWELDNSYAPNLMPLPQSLAIIDGILAALEYSHAHQVIHRDLKPENVMITPEAQVKVMDFGLARIQGQSRLTQEGLVAGTASYLAPELALGEPGDHRVDLYALGVMMYELLTGRLPFSGDDPLTIISQHIHAPIVPPQRYNPNISNELQAIILKLMAKHASERYANAADVRRDLAPILAFYRGEQPVGDSETPQPPSVKSDTTHQAILERIGRGKMIGREVELAELKRRWDLVRRAEPGLEPVLLVSGESGIGKTRLLRELEVYAGLRNGYVLRATAREADAGTPYALIASAVRSYINEQSIPVLRRQAPGFIAGEVVKLAPQLAEKLGYIQPNPALGPEAERARLLEQVSKFVLNMTLERPTLLLLDDLHFADPGSLDIIETLAHNTAGQPLLIAGAYRDVAVGYSTPINHHIAAMAATHLAHRVQLRRLPESAVQQMLEALLGDPVNPEFTQTLYNITEGNPLFVEEVVKSLALDGQIVLREGHWEQRPSAQLHVPGSVKSVLGARLKRIKKSTLELLQLAATIGRHFSLDLFAAASPYREEVIEAAFEEAFLYQLIEVSKIVDTPSSADINVYYQFEHAVIRETLYEELRPLRRRQLHRRVAAAMEKLSDGHLSENPAVLAFHFIAGAQDEKAVPYLCQAGDQARQVHANAEAADYFSQAREILEDVAVDLPDETLRANLVERYQLLNQERGVLSLMSDRNRELAALEAMQEVAQALNDQTRWVEVHSRLAMYYWQVGRLNTAEEIARQALAVAQDNQDRRGEQYSLEQIARVLWTRRDADSMTYATQALVIAQDLGDRRREGRLTELIGHIYTDTLHDPGRAAIYFEQALAICRETGNRLEEAWTLWGMGGLAQFVNDYPLALQRYSEAKAIAETLGATLQVGWDVYDMGNAWYNLGNYEQAIQHIEQAQVIFNSSNHVRGKIYALISLGLIFMATDQLESAIIYLEQALRQAEERQESTLKFPSYQALAAYYQRLGDEDSLTHAIRLSNDIIKQAAGSNHYENELLGHYLRAVSLYQLREFDQALASSSFAIKQLERLTYLHSIQISPAEIYFGHSQILAALGQREDAQTYLHTAYTETMRKANLITAESLRRDFLHNIPINRQILRANPSQ